MYGHMCPTNTHKKKSYTIYLKAVIRPHYYCHFQLLNCLCITCPCQGGYLLIGMRFLLWTFQLVSGLYDMDHHVCCWFTSTSSAD